jgi:hypothetical protein
MGDAGGDVSDLEARQLASAFRPGHKPLLITVVANASMALLLLGVPYWRGHSLAATQRRDFARFATCLIGGQIAQAPGLSLPRGERDHFAAKVMFAKPDWPAVCKPALRKLAPAEAIFLWPSVKQAGADLRAAVSLVEREMAALALRRKQGPGRIPERPLEAFKRLQAATVLYVRSAGADADIDNDAIRFDQRPTGLATPARLPLMAGQSSIMQVWSSELALEALAVDGRGLSYLRVADGKIDRERVRRTSFLRGVLRAGATPYVVWAMPDARCKEREDRCAGRPTGLAPYDRGGNSLAEPRWKLAGHPAARLDRVMQLSELGRVDMIARAAPDGTLALLRFRLPPETPGGPTQPAVTLEPSERWPVHADVNAASVTLLPGEPSAVLRAFENEQGVSATLTWGAQDNPPLQLPAASGAGAWAIGCTLGTGQVLAYGSTSQLRIWRSDAVRGNRELLVQDVALLAPLHDENPALDQVRLLCDTARAHLLFTSAQHELSEFTCDADSCSASPSIAQHVVGFSAVTDGDGLIVAFAGSLQEAVVRVLRLDARGIAQSQALAPAACWEPLGGMCGTPTLVRDAQRLVLTAHDGSDLLALESRDRGRSFATLAGVVVVGSFEPSTTSPLQQHRRRKGLE